MSSKMPNNRFNVSKLTIDSVQISMKCEDPFSKTNNYKYYGFEQYTKKQN